MYILPDFLFRCPCSSSSGTVLMQHQYTLYKYRAHSPYKNTSFFLIDCLLTRTFFGKNMDSIAVPSMPLQNIRSCKMQTLPRWLLHAPQRPAQQFPSFLHESHVRRNMPKLKRLWPALCVLQSFLQSFCGFQKVEQLISCLEDELFQTWYSFLT